MLRPYGKRSGRRCVADPEFGDRGVEEETDPKGGAEDCVEVEGGGATGGDGDGYEYADDRADGGYGEADGEGTDHPFTVEGDLAVTDVPEGFG